MRISKLPPAIAEKVLVLDEFAQVCERAADQAEAELATTRATLRGDFPPTGITKDDRETMLAAQAGFDDVLKRSQAARARATTERAVVNAVKAWVAGLAEGTALAPVEPVVSDGIDLSTVRNKITGLRAEIAKIRNAPSPAPDIETKIRDYVAELARAARPLVQGYASGQRLDVQWPASPMANRRNGEGFFTDAQANPLLMTALFSPDALIAYLLAQVAALSNELMPLQDRPAKLAALAAELEQWERLAALLTDQAIANGATDLAHDPVTPPPILLGCELGARQEAAA